MPVSRAVRFPLDALPCAAACADSRLRITAANSSFVKRWSALGGNPAKLPGSYLSGLFPPDERARYRRELWRRRQGKPQPFSLPLGLGEGVVEVAPLSGEQSARWLVTLSDDGRVQDDGGAAAVGPLLTAAVAHDMKTPLQAVLGWVSLLRKKPVDATRLDEVLNIVERNARLQVQMINDLLDASRSHDADAPLHCASVDLGKLVQRTLERLKPSTHDHRVVVSEHAPDGPVIVWADAARLERIVANLIENAIKFSAPGGAIECRIDSEDAWGRLIVRDQGRGISAEFLPHVFDPFKQEPRYEDYPPDGVGLGLAIVRHLVQMHGGHVRVESGGRGHGATFTVTLPLSAGRRVVTRDRNAHPRAS